MTKPQSGNLSESLKLLSKTARWKEYRDAYQQVVKIELPQIFTELVRELPRTPSLPRKTYRVLEGYARGGKKLRGALILIGYQCLGGKNLADVVRASIAYEIIHAAFLIHDDIMDRALQRRGEPTAHVTFAKTGEKMKLQDSEQFGRSMGISTGDIGPALAYDIVCSAHISPERIVGAIRHLNRVIMDTVRGQSLDVGTAMDSMPTEHDILRIHELKTAIYTLSGALQFGAVLAGANETADGRATLRAMGSYGIPVGIAFQIQDDYLGTFSTVKTLGKSITSDLEERKNTLLFLHTIKRGTSKQRRILWSALGKSNIDSRKLKEVKQAIKDSGAVEYSQKKARNLVDEGRGHIGAITTDGRLQRLLHEIAEFVIGRDL